MRRKDCTHPRDTKKSLDILVTQKKKKKKKKKKKQNKTKHPHPFAIDFCIKDRIDPNH